MSVFKSALTVILVLILSAALEAQIIRSVASGNWSSPSSWEGGNVPSPADDVIISNGHIILLDVTYTGNTTTICHSLEVQIDGDLHLGYNGADQNKKYAITGNLTCDGTIAAGREVPADINSGEGLLYDHNSALIMILSSPETSLSGKGYLHPKSLLIENDDTEKLLTIDHYNILTDRDLLIKGFFPINVDISKDTYLNVGGTFGISGGDYNNSSASISSTVSLAGVAYVQNLSLFTRNPDLGSTLRIVGEGVISTNVINGGNVSAFSASLYQLEIDANAIFRCGKDVSSPADIASNDPNFQVVNNGLIKLHYSNTLTSASNVMAQIEAVDTSSYAEMLPIKDKIGATHIGGWYNFTNDPFLIEGKERFKEWGSRNIKTTISADNEKMYSAYPFNHAWPTYNEPADVIKNQYVDSLFSDTYFTTHAFWAPSKGVNGYYKNGPDCNHQKYLETEQQIYLAAKEILIRYGDLGKTFIFQNWEGDWMLRGSNRQWEDNPGTIPDDVSWQIEGMARMWRAHMRGIEKAVEEFPNATSEIQYAVEFNKLYKNVNGVRETMMDLGVPNVLANVIPKVRMHLSSWSSYDGLFDEPASRPFPTGLWNGLEIASYYTNSTKNLSGIPAQIGEVGLNENPLFSNFSEQKIKDYYDKIVRMTSALGVQNIYMWNLYGSGAQSVALEKDTQYEASYLYDVLDGKWVIEPDNTLGVAAQYLKDNFFKSGGNGPTIVNPVDNANLAIGFGTINLDLSVVFEHNVDFSISAQVANQSIITAEISNQTLTINEVSSGSTQITLVATDIYGLESSFSFTVTVGENSPPILLKEIQDLNLTSGFNTMVINLDTIFFDQENDMLSISAGLNNEFVISTMVDQGKLIINEEGIGVTDVYLNASDELGRTISTTFKVSVGVISGIDKESKMQLYPNPVKDSFRLNTGNRPGQLEIINLQGRVLLSQAYSSNEAVNVQRLNPGIYLIKAILDDGQLLNFKIIIDR